jgi:hypothetical protein
MSRKEPKPIAWQVIALKATGRVLGVVHAVDEDEARATAIAQFDVRDPEKIRLLVRRI